MDRKLEKKIKKYLKSRAGLLTNHSGFGYKNHYHFQVYSDWFELIRIFVPEHGLFAELQDQVSGAGLQYFSAESEFWNIYGDNEDSLVPPDEKLKDLDLVIIDIRDVGARYYTFLTSAFYLLQKISELNQFYSLDIQVLVVDSPNPIGDLIEGSPLEEEFASFVGVPGVLHRHGLSPWELLSYYNNHYYLNLSIERIAPGLIHPEKYNDSNWVPPSPNIPIINTCLVYPGQCLLEGTNVSEGRGTTRPFEMFGAPFINYEETRLREELEDFGKGSFILRPIRYIPTFHKYSGQICGGFQIHIQNKKKFRPLRFSLKLIRTLREFYPAEFRFLEGVYEFRSDRPAIELLVGDRYLLDYCRGKSKDKEMEEYLHDSESVWKLEVKRLRKHLVG
jgi:uncharacterized protein YbbC (DUF1343 family)